jgi:cell division septation protein DedD
MLRSGEKETEILLGNTQLLGIFFVVAILLGVAFYGGYVVGKGAGPKSAAVGTATLPAPEETKPAAIAPTGGETHSVPADSGTATEAATPSASAATPREEPPLGSRDRNKNRTRTQAESGSEPGAVAEEAGSFSPRAGQTFLQVTAVGRDEAQAIADVLEKKGFRAHAVPKPGSAKLYRVIVGPIHDAGDLSSTRDSLRKTGFREVIVQRY